MGLFTETMYGLDARENVDLAHLDDSEEKVTSVLQILRARLRTFTPNELKIRLDGQDLSGQYILLEVMNISYVGPNLCLAPHAHPGDGLLDIVFVSAGDQDKLGMCLSEMASWSGLLSLSAKVSNCRSSGMGLPCTLMTRFGRKRARLFPSHQT